MGRKLSYGRAIREAFAQLLASDPRVFLMGVGVNSPWYMGSTTTDLDKEFGSERVIDIPISENGVTGMAVGAAMAGMRPVMNHPRMDFMHYAMDPIVNHASAAHYMFGGNVRVPVTIRGVVNRGGEQSSQHSQALHALYAHVPGLKVVLPSTAHDAKGLLIAAVRDGNPVIYIDDRWLYDFEDEVPEEMYEVPIGQGAVRREGDELTLVAILSMVPLACRVADRLPGRVEVIDPRSIKPLDFDLIACSVAKTGRLLVVDAAWRTGGFAGEILARVAEEPSLFGKLKTPLRRLTLPDCHAPASRTLEEAYYLDEAKIEAAAREILADTAGRSAEPIL
jgi:pyruvate dehydrogenase E1 component beta subunit